MKLFILLLALFFTLNAQAETAPWIGNSLDGTPCNGGGQGFGPFDYTNTEHKNRHEGGGSSTVLSIVEGAHFIPDVENLVKGNRGTLESDLNYTLRAWPNHHRALLSIIRYQLNIQKKLMTGKLETPPECYLQRAIHFSPKDAASYSLYGYYLSKTGQPEAAVKYYDQAMSITPNNAKIAYSYGLLLADLKRYEEAVKYAKVAYQNKQTPKGLKQKLQKQGIWVEIAPYSKIGNDIPNSSSPKNE